MKYIFPTISLLLILTIGKGQSLLSRNDSMAVNYLNNNTNSYQTPVSNLKSSLLKASIHNDQKALIYISNLVHEFDSTGRIPELSSRFILLKTYTKPGYISKDYSYNEQHRKNNTRIHLTISSNSVARTTTLDLMGHTESKIYCKEVNTLVELFDALYIRNLAGQAAFTFQPNRGSEGLFLHCRHAMELIKT